MPGLALGATSVGNNVSVGGTLGVTGATPFDGAVTLGDAAADLITLTGYFNTMTVGNLTSTSTLTKDTLAVGAVAADKLGKFYVNASGNVSASGTLSAVGNVNFDSGVILGNSVADSIRIIGMY